MRCKETQGFILGILCGVFCNVDRGDVAAQRTSLYDGGIPCDACTCHNVQKWSKKIITIVVIAAMSLLYTAAFVAGNYQIW